MMQRSTRRTGRRGAAAALALAAAIVAGACGSGDAPTGTAAVASGPDARPATTRSVVPAVDVVDVATGRTVALRDRVASDRPSLLWLWAPS